MLADRYGNELTTRSVAAQDAYIEAVDRFLAADGGVEHAFERSIAADDGFALAHLGLARFRHAQGNPTEAKRALGAARELAGGVTDREAGQINALGLLIEGKAAEAYKAIRTHLADHPRDAMATQTCTTVFGLIGFSGQPGREAEQLAFTTELAPHYGDDWWFLSQHAFSQIEVGQIGPAEASIERSLEGNPRSAQGAHIRSHIYYENGEQEAGYRYLSDWRRDYDKTGLLHCHVSWHVALWALEQGELEEMWRLIDTDISPGAAIGPPLVVLCDSAAALYRASLMGVDIAPERWNTVCEYASKYFPNTGVAFGDVHAALAYAMAGDREALDRIISDAKGPAGDVVRDLAEAFGAIAQEGWAEAETHLTNAMSDHARIGGSKAQRDLIEFAMTVTLLKQGRAEEARRLLAIRRPVISPDKVVMGM